MAKENVSDPGDQPSAADQFDLNALVMRCLEAADSDREKARELLESELTRKHKDFFAAFKRQAVQDKLAAAIRDAEAQSRYEAARALSKPLVRQPGFDAMMIKINAKACWLERWMVNGKPLGEVTKAELLAHTSMMEKEIKTKTATMHFEAAIAARLDSDTSKVKDVLKERDIEKLAKEHNVKKE